MHVITAIICSIASDIRQELLRRFLRPAVDREMGSGLPPLR